MSLQSVLTGKQGPGVARRPNRATASMEEILVSKKQNEEPVLVQQLLARSR